MAASSSPSMQSKSGAGVGESVNWNECPIAETDVRTQATNEPGPYNPDTAETVSGVSLAVDRRATIAATATPVIATKTCWMQ